MEKGLPPGKFNWGIFVFRFIECFTKSADYDCRTFKYVTADCKGSIMNYTIEPVKDLYADLSVAYVDSIQITVGKMKPMFLHEFITKDWPLYFENL